MMMRSIIFGLALVSFTQLASAAPGNAELPEEQPELPLMNSNAWAFDIDQDAEIARHDLTGMTCPFQLEGTFFLDTLAQYKLAGEDVGCNYIREDRGAFITFYMSWYQSPASAKEFAESNIANISAVKPIGKRLKETASTMALGNITGDCFEISLELNHEDTPTITGSKHCRLGSWILKMRITHTANDTNHHAAMTSFIQQQEKMTTHLEQCIAAPARTEQARLIEGTADSGISAMLVVLAQEALFEQGLGDKLFDETPSSDSTDTPLNTNCVMLGAASTNKGFLFSRALNDARVPYKVFESTVYKRSEAPVAWLETNPLFSSALSDNSSDKSVAIYGLWKTVRDDKKAIYRLYEGMPGDDQLIADTVSVLSNEIEPIASISFNENGGSSINVLASAIEDSEQPNETSKKQPTTDQ